MPLAAYLPLENVYAFHEPAETWIWRRYAQDVEEHATGRPRADEPADLHRIHARPPVHDAGRRDGDAAGRRAVQPPGPLGVAGDLVGRLGRGEGLRGDADAVRGPGRAAVGMT